MLSPEDIRNNDTAPAEAAFFQKERFPLYLILENLRSSYNVGSVFRTCDSTCITKLFLCGYTPLPPDLGISKTALGAEEYVPWEYAPEALAVVEFLQSEGIFVAAFETTSKSINLYDFSFPKPAAIVVGNEKDGISLDVLNRADAVVQVPAWGYKNSLNAANLCGIALYEAIRQYGKSEKLFCRSHGTA